MKKQLLLTLAAGLALNLSTASAHYNIKGWYAGVQGGVQNTHSKDMKAVVAGVTSRIDGGRSGGVAGIMAGYGHVWKKWYLAAQAEVSGGNFNHTSIVGADTHKLKASTVWGVAALAGYEIIPNSVGYVRLGVDWANWRLSNAGTINSSRSGSRAAFAPGVGVRMMVAKNVFINAEYKHSFFRKISLVSGANSVSATPRLQTFTVGVAFKM